MTRPASGCTHVEARIDDQITPHATPNTAERIGATVRFYGRITLYRTATQ